MVRIAVVGAGHWGPNFINNFHTSKRSEVAWVVDRDQARIAAVKERFPGVRTSLQFDDVLEDSSVDAIVVATPTKTHFDLARRALESGKHVLVEKPMTDSSATSEELCEISNRVGRVLMVGHIFIFNDAAGEVKRIIESGALGRIYYVSMVRTNLGPIRIDVDASWDLATHDVSLVSHWLDAFPSSVSAVGGSWINSGIADAVFATLRYPNDVLVNLHSSWLNPRKARDITVVGEGQMLTFDDLNLMEPLRIYDKQVMGEQSEVAFVDSFASFRMSVRTGDITIPRVPTGEPLRNECESFLDCVIDGETPLSGGPEGLSVVRVLEAMARSLREGGSEIKVEGQ